MTLLQSHVPFYIYIYILLTSVTFILWKMDGFSRFTAPKAFQIQNNEWRRLGFCVGVLNQCLQLCLISIYAMRWDKPNKISSFHWKISLSSFFLSLLQWPPPLAILASVSKFIIHNLIENVCNFWSFFFYFVVEDMLCFLFNWWNWGFKNTILPYMILDLFCSSIISVAPDI